MVERMGHEVAVSSDDRSPLVGLELFLLTFALGIAAFMQILDTAITNVSLPYISGDLSVSVNQGTWVITSYAVGSAVGLPISGWLSTYFGSVRVMTWTVFLFTLLSVFCGAAMNLEFLLVCRFVQGLSGGPIVPLGQSLLLQNYPAAMRNFAISLFITIIAIGPIVGPVLGGWISYDYNWRWIFYINVPFGLASCLIIWFLLSKRETTINKTRVDWVGFLLLLIGVTALQILLDKGEQYDWFDSPVINMLGALAVVCLTFLCIWEWHKKNPVVDIRLFKIKNFALATGLIFISYIMVFGAIVVIPLWLQTRMGYTGPWAGLVVAPMGVFFLLFGVMIGKLMDRFGIEKLLTFAFALFTVAFLNFAFLTTDVTFGHMAISVLAISAAAAFWFAPTLSLALKGMPPDKIAAASGIFYFFRTYGLAVGTSLVVYLWDRRTIFHHFHLTETITGPSLPTQQKALLDLAVDKQASLLALNDLFLLSGACCFGLFLILLTLSFRRKPSKT
jgi:DHA2 family multidrug resistance protein